MNKKVASFKYNGRSYEIDKLLDSETKEGFVYDLFDVTGVGAVSLAHFGMSHGVTEAELVEEAKRELELLV